MSVLIHSPRLQRGDHVSVCNAKISPIVSVENCIIIEKLPILLLKQLTTNPSFGNEGRRTTFVYVSINVC